jgi:flagellar biogenesis protein FliO
MKKLLLLIFITTSLFSSTIINHVISIKKDAINIIFVFDKPYKGSVLKKVEDKSAILTLDNVKVRKGLNEDIFSDIVQQLSLISYKNKTYIELIGRNKFDVSFIKSADKTGIKIKVIPFKEVLQKQHSVAPVKKIQPIKEKKVYKTKNDSNIMMSFLKVLLVLGLLAAILYLLRMFLLNKGTSEGSWLFNKSDKESPQMKIIYQKMIDSKTKTALLEFNNIRYLVLIGSEGNLLLDKYDSELKQIKSDNFDDVLEKNTKKLDDFMNLQNKQFNNYKQRASRDIASSF